MVNRFSQPNNIGNLISIGNTKAKVLNGGQTGVPQPQLGCISVVPLTASTTNLASAVAATSGAGYITITAGTGITAVTGISNTFTNTTDTIYSFDTPRAVIITEAAGGTAVTYTVWGFDQDNVFMTENIAVAGGVGATTGTGKKAFAGITRVWASAASTAAISVGTTNIIGLPYVLDNVNRIFGTGNFGTGATFGAVATYVAAVATTPATATTGDIRGTVTLPTAADGTKRLVVTWVLAASTNEVDLQNYAAIYGVSQYAAPYN
jgi:hypothetical protein